MERIEFGTFWEGHNIRDLTRDELIVAFEELGRLYRAYHDDHVKGVEKMKFYHDRLDSVKAFYDCGVCGCGGSVEIPDEWLTRKKR